MAKAKRKKQSDESICNDYQYIINTDGACAGNPGPIGLGGIILENFPNKRRILSFSEGVPYGTNNEAEYLAVIKALEEFINLNLDAEALLIQSDSQVVIKQLNGSCNFNNARLAKLNNRVKRLLKQLPCEVTFKWIPRVQNKVADMLAGESLKNTDALKYSIEENENMILVPMI